MKTACQLPQETANKKRLYGIEARPPIEGGMLTLPLPEIIVDTKAEVEALAGTLGVLVMKACIEDEVRRLVGDRYKRQEGRCCARWGSQGGSVVFAGQKVRIRRPRVRDLREAKEVALASYHQFRNGEKLSEAVASKLLLGVSFRQYRQAIEGFCDGCGIERSSVSRLFVQATSRKLKTLTERSLAGADFIAIMIDGIEYQGHLIVVAVGIARDGSKQVLGLRLGATENTVVVTELLESLVERGLDPLRPMLFVLDGSKALSKAVRSLWGARAVIQRCQVHKLRNIRAHLAERHQATILTRIREAYAMEGFEEAKASLMTTVRYLERLNPDAARSLEEGLVETLTVHRLGLRGALRKTLSSTNVIENCQGTTRRITRNVKRWRDGAMVLRWVGCALLVAEKRFHRIKGHRDLMFLKGALQKFVAGNDVDSYAMVA